MTPKPAICLTFDLEEFDLPTEYAQPVDMPTQFEVTRLGMKLLLPLLDEFNASCTFFTTAHFAENNPHVIRELSSRHEVASHSYFHSSFKVEDLGRAKQVLENIRGAKITGFRMPRMQQINYHALRAAGYAYDSSLHPTWIPGRYNNFSEPRLIHRADGLAVFPASVTPVFRSPLFWLSFKNVSPARYNRWVQKCLDHDGYANIYLHPWEFSDMSAYKLPRYIAKNATWMLKRLRAFLEHFKARARFLTIQNLLEERNEL